MTLHHPNQNLLVEFAAGTLPIAQAIAIKAHLHFCPQCQQTVRQMEHVGGAMLENLGTQPLPDDSFDQLMTTIEQKQKQRQTTSKDQAIQQSDQYDPALPNLINKLMTQKPLKWKRLTRTLQTAPLAVGQRQFEVSLQRIRAGDTVPEHDHRGIEMTVVLEGCFSDRQGIYQQGDFLVKNPGDIHQPISARNQDCLCLAVQEAPVKLTGLWGKLLNPFIKLHAA